VKGIGCASLEQCGDDELTAALEPALRSALGRSCSIAGLERRRSEFCSSRALEELDVRLDVGTRLELIVKDVGPEGEIAAARNTRPDFLRDPYREIAIYQDVLGRHSLGTPAFYGAAIDRQAGRFWLFLERVAGHELYRVGDLDIWMEAARWLAKLHSTFSAAGKAAGPMSGTHLIAYDREYFQRWIQRAREFAHSGDRARADAIEWLSTRYEAVVARLVAMPRTLIHGEFYASNVLAQKTEGGLRICPIDWEMAGWGPPLIDLAALVSGTWSTVQVVAFTGEYCSAFSTHSGDELDGGSVQEALCCCRLHLAMQCLGWAPNWKPPSEHRRDWLADALRHAEQLCL